MDYTVLVSERALAAFSLGKRIFSQQWLPRCTIEVGPGGNFRIDGGLDQMIKRILSVSPWVSLVLVAVATLSPLTLRPHVSAAHVEHLAAYVFIGFLFGLIYPRQMFFNCVVVLGTATLLETLQLLTPDRHGRIEDLAFKLAGAIAGIVVGKIAARQIVLWRR